MLTTGSDELSRGKLCGSHEQLSYTTEAAERKRKRHCWDIQLDLGAVEDRSELNRSQLTRNDGDVQPHAGTTGFVEEKRTDNGHTRLNPPEAPRDKCSDNSRTRKLPPLESWEDFREDLKRVPTRLCNEYRRHWAREEQENASDENEDDDKSGRKHRASEVDSMYDQIEEMQKKRIDLAQFGDYIWTLNSTERFVLQSGESTSAISYMLDLMENPMELATAADRFDWNKQKLTTNDGGIKPHAGLTGFASGGVSYTRFGPEILEGVDFLEYGPEVLGGEGILRLLQSSRAASTAVTYDSSLRRVTRGVEQHVLSKGRLITAEQILSTDPKVCMPVALVLCFLQSAEGKFSTKGIEGALSAIRFSTT